MLTHIHHQAQASMLGCWYTGPYQVCSLWSWKSTLTYFRFTLIRLKSVPFSNRLYSSLGKMRFLQVLPVCMNALQQTVPQVLLCQLCLVSSVNSKLHIGFNFQFICTFHDCRNTIIFTDQLKSETISSKVPHVFKQCPIWSVSVHGQASSVSVVITRPNYPQQSSVSAIFLEITIQIRL